MLSLGDLLAVWDKLNPVQRVQALLDRIKDLEAKVAALEEKLAAPCPPDCCRFCGAKSARLSWTMPADAKGYTKAGLAPTVARQTIGSGGPVEHPDQKR